MTNRCTFDFTGTSVLVTGGTSGIGHAVASSFADAGAVVTVTGTRADASAYETDLARFRYRPLDLRDAAAVDALAADVDRLDVLVNNGGATFPDEIRDAMQRVVALPERPTVEAYGGQVMLIDYLPGHSTTELIARVKALP